MSIFARYVLTKRASGCMLLNMTTTTTDLHVADTIAAQNGGRALAMFGARDLGGSRDGSLTFRIGANRAKATHIRVTLTPADLYQVEVIKISRRYDVTTLRTIDGVSAEQLAETIGSATGLYWSL